VTLYPFEREVEGKLSTDDEDEDSSVEGEDPRGRDTLHTLPLLPLISTPESTPRTRRGELLCHPAPQEEVVVVVVVEPELAASVRARVTRSLEREAPFFEATTLESRPCTGVWRFAPKNRAREPEGSPASSLAPMNTPESPDSRTEARKEACAVSREKRESGFWVVVETFPSWGGGDFLLPPLEPLAAAAATMVGGTSTQRAASVQLWDWSFPHEKGSPPPETAAVAPTHPSSAARRSCSPERERERGERKEG